MFNVPLNKICNTIISYSIITACYVTTDDISKHILLQD